MISPLIRAKTACTERVFVERSLVKRKLLKRLLITRFLAQPKQAIMPRIAAGLLS
jgi:hypothetical protein